MNKKLATVIISCLTILLTFLMVVFSAFRLSHPPEACGQEVQPLEINYELAYPGILPDHPLYWLKMIRDRIWGSLIHQPVQKTSWLVLMADKRAAAAQQLVIKNQDKLALTTASKAEKYLERAVNKFVSLELNQQIGLRSRLEQAVGKHEHVIKNMSQQVEVKLSSDFEALLVYPQQFKTLLSN